jgi:hypothetical protein
MIVRIYGFADIYGHTNMAALNLGHHYGRHRHLTHGAAFHFSNSTAFSTDYQMFSFFLSFFIFMFFSFSLSSSPSLYMISSLLSLVSSLRYLF